MIWENEIRNRNKTVGYFMRVEVNFHILRAHYTFSDYFYVNVFYNGRWSYI